MELHIVIYLVYKKDATKQYLSKRFYIAKVIITRYRSMANNAAHQKRNNNRNQKLSFLNKLKNKLISHISQKNERK